MIAFLRENARWLGYGFLLTLFASFGQTWFISLFADQIKAAHGLSDGGWGSLYTVATLASGLLLFLRGSLADTVSFERLGPYIAAGFAVSCLMLGYAPHIAFVGVALFGLRFCGQGMFGHIAMTAMGRWFVERRGRAVAIAGFGHSAGEIVFPLPALLLVAAIGWRSTWAIVAAILVLIVLPILIALPRQSRQPKGQDVAQDITTGLDGRHWQRAEVIRHWLFPALLPLLLTPGFIGTVIFFHQAHIAEVKGWTLTQMAPGYAVFATLTVTASFIAGLAIDRFGVARVLPVLLLPEGIGIALLGGVETTMGWFMVLGVIAITQGMTGALLGTLFPAAYGTRHLGAIRALGTTVMVISTAIGPGLTGLLIDAGITFPEQGPAMGLWCLASCLWAMWIFRRLQRETQSTNTRIFGPQPQ